MRGGANLIDVNMDEGLLDSEQAMTHFLNLIATEPEISRLPIVIDSSPLAVSLFRIAAPKRSFNFSISIVKLSGNSSGKLFARFEQSG